MEKESPGGAVQVSQPDFIAAMIQFVDQTLQSYRVKKDQQAEQGGMNRADQVLNPTMLDVDLHD